MENNINLQNLKGRFIQQAQVKTSAPSSPAPQNPTPAPQPTTNNSAQTNFTQNLQSAIMGNTENATYAKEMMKFPKNFNAFIHMVQKNLTAAQIQAQLHQNLLAGKQLSQTQAQILAQLQGFNSAELMNGKLNANLLAQLEAGLNKLPISANGMINIANLAELIKANGKEAITQIIINMANSAKNGINDVSQMKEAAKLINNSIAVAAQKDNSQTLKMLMLLYLPWLPLQQGVDFELEILSQNEENSDNSILIIKIQTINFGEIVATLVLEDSNAVSINIECNETFPKEELSQRLDAENKHYSALTSLTYSSKQSTPIKAEKTQATINMSNTNEINPYLLLTAHQIIRNVIEIDRLASC